MQVYGARVVARLCFELARLVEQDPAAAARTARRLGARIRQQALRTT